MNQGLDNAWVRVLSLEDRASVWRSGGLGAADSEVAESRVAEWYRATMPEDRAAGVLAPDVGSLRARRLAELGLAEADFTDLLSTSADSLLTTAGEAPRWFREIGEALADGRNGTAEPASTTWQSSTSWFALLAAVEPLLRRSLRFFEQQAREVTRPPVTGGSSLSELFVPSLLANLTSSLTPTLVLELNVARLNGELGGDTPEERFDAFVERLRSPERRVALFNEYPVLVRLVQCKIDQWIEVSLELLERLERDREALSRVFSGGQDLGALLRVAPGFGDRHHGGRAVTLVELTSGLRLMYKPRSLALDVRFQELIGWLSQRGLDPDLRPLRVLDRGEYGWVEYVEPDTCTTSEQVSRFYRRMGSYLAVLYALNAADMHYENVIACGEYPVLVDGETLLHPDLALEGVEDKAVGRALLACVIRIGLLPNRSGAREGYEGFDFGGLSARPGQQAMIRSALWAGTGTDQMHAEARRLPHPGGKNRPTLNGNPVDVLEHRSDLDRGFVDTYRLLLANKEELLARGGPIDRFADAPVRFLARATRVYALLLAKARHPDHMRDAIDRDLLFEHLWAASAHIPSLQRLVPEELKALRDDTIPCWTLRPDQRDLYSDSGARIEGFFDETCLDRVRSKVDGLSESDLEFQRWLVGLSFVHLADEGREGAGEPLRPITREATIPDGEPAPTVAALLAEAGCVADRLAQIAIRGDGTSSWIVLKTSLGGESSAMTLGNAEADLYRGLPGVLLFLAYLQEVGGDRCHEALLREGLALLETKLDFLATIARRSVSGDSRAWRSVGAFSGWGGVLYLLMHLHHLWKEPAVLSRLQEVLEILHSVAEAEEETDIISGAAGLIAVLLAAEPAGIGGAVELAVRCGDRLVASAQPAGPGLAWPSPRYGRPLTGFAHGAAGNAWALLRLWERTGLEQYRETALAALRFENSFFDSEIGTWKDRRWAADESPAGPQRTPPCAWCHGAAGITLARLDTLPLVDEPWIRSEIYAGLECVLRQGFGANHSLCHGDLGNVEILLRAAEVLGEEIWIDRWRAAAAAILGGLRARGGWRCGTVLGLETPDLMTGLAGIGFGLLRLARPDAVPSVLLLEGPRSGVSSDPITSICIC